MISRRSLTQALAVMPLGLSLFGQGGAAASPDGAASFVEGLIDKAMKVLRIPLEQRGQRESEFRTLLRANFDVPLITRLVVGRHWRRATADQQQNLVEAQIEVKRSEQFAVARRNEGLGERDKLNLIAEGQKSQAQVLGEDRVVELRRFELVVNSLLDFFKENPEVLTAALSNAHKFVPERVFTLGGDGSANNLAGAAAVLGDFLSSDTSSTAKGQQAP